MRGARTAARAMAALCAFAFAGYLYLAYAPAGDAAPHPFNQDRNAVWLEHKWLTEPQPVPDMEALLSSLRRRGIGYVFPHVIPFDPSGRLPAHDREQMRAFLAAARRTAPGMKVLPWVGGLRAGHRRQREGTLVLGDLGQRQRMAAECRGLVDEGFDGVHVNVEPVPNGDVDFLAFLRALRVAVGPSAILSVSTTRPGPFHLAVAPNFVWTPDYYARVGRVADQLVVMAYDTALPTPALYRRYLAYVGRAVTETLTAENRARVLVGVPTYDETGLMHRGHVETPENALLGLVDGLRGSRGGTFEGVALYAEWTTDQREWAVYDRWWRNVAR